MEVKYWPQLGLTEEILWCPQTCKVGFIIVHACIGECKIWYGFQDHFGVTCGTK